MSDHLPIPPSQNPTKFHGFDYLRVFFMFSVVSVHSNWVVGLAAQREQQVGVGPNFWDFFNLQLQAIAVPTFVLISCFLFLLKPVTWKRFRAREIKLCYLYFFWVGSWMYYTKPIFTPHWQDITELFMRGGGWQFYFIAVLILMTICSALIGISQGMWRWLCYLACVIGFAITTYQAFHQNSWISSPYYWLPSCFLLLPCFAQFLVDRRALFLQSGKSLTLVVIIFLMLAVFSASVEWNWAAAVDMLDVERRWLPRHARPSVHLAALALTILSLGIRRPPGPIIHALARNSLGVYCLHGFVLGGFIKAAQELFGPRLPYLVMPAACLSVVLACCLASEFLRRAFSSRLV